MYAKNTWSNRGTDDVGGRRAPGASAADRVSDRSSAYPSVVLPEVYVNVSVTATDRVPAGTVPEAVRWSSSVVLPRSELVTGASDADPSAAPAAFRKVSPTPTRSFWLDQPPSHPDSAYPTEPPSIAAEAAETSTLWPTSSWSSSDGSDSSSSALFVFRLRRARTSSARARWWRARFRVSRTSSRSKGFER